LGAPSSGRPGAESPGARKAKPTLPAVPWSSRPRTVDDAARVHGGAHNRVSPHARQFEGAEPLHEEGPLLGEEDGVALVDLHLERVALDLAEVRI
jgi:hypothetical protein